MNSRFSKPFISAFIFISSCLYSNSLHPEIKPDEDILFYPTYAYLNNEGIITCKVHGHIFEKEEDSIIRKALLHSIMEAAEEDEKSEQYNPYLAERIKPFLYDNEGDKIITVRINGKDYTLDESHDNGHFNAEIRLKSSIKKTGTVITYNVNTAHDDRRKFTGSSIFISRSGISVISDIDDTIKESNVLNKKELLKNTFLREFKAVKGMSSFYKKLKSQGAAFHYVSGSPWQLYPSISGFIKKSKFPAGSFHLKYIRAKDSSIIDFITADQLSFKVNNIESILKDFPGRKFILIGDSGEFDPEVYTEITQRHREQIKAVYIRDVNKPGDTPARYEKLKAMEPEIKFTLFKDPGELRIP
ncbi:MAG TPA: App1 family protein [Spirochaetota bacterium]|nr:App1 family protein [Spirochaetota bacterium]